MPPPIVNEEEDMESECSRYSLENVENKCSPIDRYEPQNTPTVAGVLVDVIIDCSINVSVAGHSSWKLTQSLSWVTQWIMTININAHNLMLRRVITDLQASMWAYSVQKRTRIQYILSTSLRLRFREPLEHLNACACPFICMYRTKLIPYMIVSLGSDQLYHSYYQSCSTLHWSPNFKPVSRILQPR